MNGTWLVLVLAAALLGALLLLSPSEPALDASLGASGTQTLSPSGAGLVSSDLRVDVGGDRIVNERESIDLQAIVTGAGEFSVAWTADRGLGFFTERSRLDTRYTAPSACGCDDIVTLTLTVVDREGRTASDSLVITVRDPARCPTSSPTCVCVAPPSPCTPTVRPRCPTPDLPCASPCISQAVEPSCGEVPFPCPCNECGPIWSAVRPGANVPPGARPHAQIVRQFPRRMDEGTAVQLTGVVRNPGCVPVCFTWSASRGSFGGGDTLTPVYVAPFVDHPNGEDVTILLIVRDAAGTTSYDQIRLRIDNTDT